ncbi:protein phosphatase [Deinobacterium chartae]|uniref:Protein phosphatase n=1 Tax=Deinobacterium chartae TaxID=521158 RepID=A0A841HZD1_9DEIO|nr:protein phosphatase [Deinobacterium chartae]
MIYSEATTRLEVALLSDRGQTRALNEDCGLALSLPSGGLFAVADGMGGHNAGDVASTMAVSGLQETYLQLNGPTPQRLVRSLEQVNTRLHQEAHKPERRGMGTTLTAVVVDDGAAIIANIGDSRAYLLRGGKLTHLTRDHSWVAEQQRLGLLTEQEARVHRWRNVISNALGSAALLRLDLTGLRLEAGDQLLLCSDGLSGVLEDDRICELMKLAPSAQGAVVTLVAEANRLGGPDNITALLVKVQAVGRLPAYPLPQLIGDGPQPSVKLLAPLRRRPWDRLFRF